MFPAVGDADIRGLSGLWAGPIRHSFNSPQRCVRNSSQIKPQSSRAIATIALLGRQFLGEHHETAI
jgi:hypothetical protein